MNLLNPKRLFDLNNVFCKKNFRRTILSFQGFNLPTELSESPTIAFKPQSINFYKHNSSFYQGLHA